MLVCLMVVILPVSEVFLCCSGDYLIGYFFLADEALEFLEANHDWMTEQAEENYLNSDYWLAVKGILNQLQGIVAGVKVRYN